MPRKRVTRSTPASPPKTPAPLPTAPALPPIIPTPPPEVPTALPKDAAPPPETSANPTVSVSASQLQQMLQAVTAALQGQGRHPIVSPAQAEQERANHTVLFGGALLALSIYSFKVWRQGKSSLPFILRQSALIAAFLVKHFQTYSLTKKVFPNGFYVVVSIAMLCFYTYVMLSGGNPPPKKSKLAASPPS
ncbi:predicted GPI-anchored protein 58 [Magnolia sinica]|uniref:predicted GPI-anchored protein 58 n=1 Tax=Magnolia sinica TaxID=86752 RepID=UPI002658B326|nr:predicted GPI-anchored protein 58 [Magnolia sinica]